jgi:hypothetical protein
MRSSQRINTIATVNDYDSLVEAAPAAAAAASWHAAAQPRVEQQEPTQDCCRARVRARQQELEHAAARAEHVRHTRRDARALRGAHGMRRCRRAPEEADAREAIRHDNKASAVMYAASSSRVAHSATRGARERHFERGRVRPQPRPHQRAGTSVCVTVAAASRSRSPRRRATQNVCAGAAALAPAAGAGDCRTVAADAAVERGIKFAQPSRVDCKPVAQGGLPRARCRLCRCSRSRPSCRRRRAPVAGAKDSRQRAQGHSVERI